MLTQIMNILPLVTNYRCDHVRALTDIIDLVSGDLIGQNLRFYNVLWGGRYHGSTVVGSGDGVESLLASCVPVYVCVHVCAFI